MGEFRYIGDAALIARGLDSMERAVNDSLEDLVGRSQDAAPVDTGTLRASIHTDGAHRGGMSIEGRVETGGEANEYAVYQHEGTSRGVPATKFIERPLIESRRVYLAAMARAAIGAY